MPYCPPFYFRNGSAEIRIPSFPLASPRFPFSPPKLWHLSRSPSLKLVFRGECKFDRELLIGHYPSYLVSLRTCGGGTFSRPLYDLMFLAPALTGFDTRQSFSPDSPRAPHGPAFRFYFLLHSCGSLYSRSPTHATAERPLFIFRRRAPGFRSFRLKSSLPAALPSSGF